MILDYYYIHVSSFTSLLLGNLFAVDVSALRGLGSLGHAVPDNPIHASQVAVYDAPFILPLTSEGTDTYTLDSSDACQYREV